MRLILPAILSLEEHFNALETNPDAYRPECCPNCSKAGLWCHGCYFRQSDRENPGSQSLNPIPILRFFCSHCGKTCSVLPECIPPRRWYLWVVQEAALTFFAFGYSILQVTKNAEQYPCRLTHKRWRQAWEEQFKKHRLHLRSYVSDLGYHTGFQSFWQACLSRMQLSHAMLFLNQRGVVVP